MKSKILGRVDMNRGSKPSKVKDEIKDFKKQLNSSKTS